METKRREEERKIERDRQRMRDTWFRRSSHLHVNSTVLFFTDLIDTIVQSLRSMDYLLSFSFFHLPPFRLFLDIFSLFFHFIPFFFFFVSLSLLTTLTITRWRRLHFLESYPELTRTCNAYSTLHYRFNNIFIYIYIYIYNIYNRYFFYIYIYISLCTEGSLPSRFVTPSNDWSNRLDAIFIYLFIYFLFLFDYSLL